MEMFCIRWNDGDYSDFCLSQEQLDGELSHFKSPDDYTVSTLKLDITPQSVRDLLFRRLITDRKAIEPTGSWSETEVFSYRNNENIEIEWFELFLVRDPCTFEYVDIWIDRRQVDKAFPGFEDKCDARAKNISVDLTPEGIKDLFRCVLVVGD